MPRTQTATIAPKTANPQAGELGHDRCPNSDIENLELEHRLVSISRPTLTGLCQACNPPIGARGLDWGFCPALVPRSRPHHFGWQPSFRTGAHATVLSRVVRVAWSSTMMTDLQTKVEKYETKAAQCEERARQATDGPLRAFYEGLAHYYCKG